MAAAGLAFGSDTGMVRMMRAGQGRHVIAVEHTEIPIRRCAVSIRQEEAGIVTVAAEMQ